MSKPIFNDFDWTILCDGITGEFWTVVKKIYETRMDDLRASYDTATGETFAIIQAKISALKECIAIPETLAKEKKK